MIAVRSRSSARFTPMPPCSSSSGSSRIALLVASLEQVGTRPDIKELLWGGSGFLLLRILKQRTPCVGSE